MTCAQRNCTLALLPSLLVKHTDRSLQCIHLPNQAKPHTCQNVQEDVLKVPALCYPRLSSDLHFSVVIWVHSVLSSRVDSVQGQCACAVHHPSIAPPKDEPDRCRDLTSSEMPATRTAGREMENSVRKHAEKCQEVPTQLNQPVLGFRTGVSQEL